MIKVLWGSFKSAWEPLPCGLSKGPLNWDFLHIYLTTLSESLISKMQNLRGSFFSPKYLKFNLDFKNAAKNWEKVFCFWDNCIWIGIVKLRLLRTAYLSSASNVLTSCTNILYVNMRHFFQINWLGRDHWIWQKCCGIDFKSDWERLPCCLWKGFFLVTF